MRVISHDKETYLYLNGFTVKQPVKLDENLELLPATNKVTPQLVIATAKHGIDVGIGAIFLPLVTAQFRITESNQEKIATKAWNSVWDTVYISAFFDCYAEANFQCNVPLEQLSNTSDLHVTNHALKGLTNEIYELKDSEVEWLCANIATARKLNQHDQFSNAVHCLATYKWHTLPRAQLALIWAGIESLFKIESEIVFRVSLCAAYFLFPEDPEKRKECFHKVKKLYKARSLAVHGGKMKGDQRQHIVDSAKLLRDLLYRCVEVAGIPDVDSLVI